MIFRQTEKHMKKHMLSTICFSKNPLSMIKGVQQFRQRKKHMNPLPVITICFLSVSNEDYSSVPAVV